MSLREITERLMILRNTLAVALLPLFHGITAAVTVVGLVLWVRIVNSLMHALKECVEVTNVTLPL